MKCIIQIRCKQCGERFFTSDPKAIGSFEQGIPIDCHRCSEIKELQESGHTEFKN
jgi:hypothetical protein